MKKVEHVDGEYMIIFQYTEMLVGEKAFEAAMKEQNVPREQASVPNGFFIKEDPSDIRKYKLHSNSLSYNSESAKRIFTPRDKMIEYLQEENPYRLFNFYIVNNEIAVIVEQYLP